MTYACIARSLLAASAFAAGLVPAYAQKKPDAKERPQLTFSQPFAVPAGQTTKIIVRGLKLGGVTEVRCHEPKATVKLIGKPAKASVPDAKLASAYGDMQIELEITLPPGVTHRDVTIAAIGEAGDSPPLRLAVSTGSPVVAEKEPNNGFREAQVIEPGQTVEGAIQQLQDVDVFRFEGRAGQRVVFTAQACRYGSPLEPILTMYDSQGRTVLSSDDVGRDEDCRVALTLPHEGRYYLSLIDAHDLGGPFHRYRLQFEMHPNGK